METLKSKMMVKRAMRQMGDNRPAKKMRVDGKKQPASDNGLGPVLSTIVQTAVKRARSRVNMAAKAAKAARAAMVSSNNVAAKKTSPEVVKAAVDRAKLRVKIAARAAKGAASDNMRNTSKKPMPEMAVGNDSTKKARVDGEKKILPSNSGDLVLSKRLQDLVLATADRARLKIAAREDSENSTKDLDEKTQRAEALLSDFERVTRDDFFGSEEKSDLVSNPSPKKLIDMLALLDTSGSEDSISSGRSALSTTGDNMFMTDSDKKSTPAREPAANDQKERTSVLNFFRMGIERFVKQGWELLGKLGEGAYGLVLRVTRSSVPNETPPENALKVAFPGEGFRNEYEVLRQLNGQRGIVQLREGDKGRGSGYFVNGELAGYFMEKGLGSLESISSETPLSESLIHVMAKDLIAGGQAMSEKGFVNRDLKPDNIIVFKNSDGSLSFRISDFGTAEKEGQWVGKAGTPRYMAPEARRVLQHASSKHDVFSAGLIIAESLIKLLAKEDFSFIMSGGLEGDVNSYGALYEKKYYSPAVVLLTEVKGKYPESKDLVDLAIKMMDSDPAKRPTFSECSQSVSAFQNPTVNAHEAV